MSIYKIKKLVGLIVVGLLPLINFILFIIMKWSLLYAILASFFGIILGILIFNILTRHPLLQLLEGEGLLVLTVDSTGVITPFICKIIPPFVYARINKEDVSTLFDRDIIFYLRNPKKALIFKEVNHNNKNNKKHKNSEKTREEIVLNLVYKPEDKTKISFAFEHYPVLIYNKNLNCFLTKDSLARLEQESMVKHLVLYLKKKTEELTAIMRDFARYVIEMTKPRATPFEFLTKWWFWLIIIAIFVILIVIFLPGVMESLSGPFVTPVKEATKTIVQTR